MINPKDATSVTVSKSERLYTFLPFDNTQDFKDAKQGFIASPSEKTIKNQNGDVVWDFTKYDYINTDSKAPDTVNPSLWRQSELANITGLFRVTERIYQIRNFDISNMTIIEGDTGIIVIDPLISSETAKAALDLYFDHRPKKNIIAVIYSHSHTDHYGGVKGIVSEEDVQSGKVKIYAPMGFLDATLSEFVMAGNAMSRRAAYMYGNLLSANPKGQVGTGLGTTLSTGTITLIPPTDSIKDDETINIDGLTFEFIFTPGTEAPSEMLWYIPQLKALTIAEDFNHTLHNIYSLRGATIRSALDWSKDLHKALNKWGDKAEVLYSMHTWPVWGNDNIIECLKKERDIYRYINDQTLHLANQGYTMDEIGDMVKLPDSLSNVWENRGYYGTINHNTRATYVKYLGFFDGNPATLHQYPPVEAGKRYVEFMGGADAIISKAREYYNKGDYRWVAQVLNHVVFSDPDNSTARELEADALEQLGYQAESGPWRNFYLTGAQELRNGIVKRPATNTVSPDTVKTMNLDSFFDYMAMRLDASRANDKIMTFNFVFPDINEKYLVTLENSVLNHTKDFQAQNADATVILNRNTLNDIMLRQTSLDKEISDGNIKITNNQENFKELISLLDTFDFWFNIVTP